MPDTINATACTVKVHSCQITDTQQTESTVEARGTWNNENKILTFRENLEITDLPTTLGNSAEVETRIALTPDRIIVYRNGTLQFDFIAGETTKTAYDTAFGDINMEISTRSINLYSDAGCGSIHIEYELVMDSDFVSMCVYEVTFQQTADTKN